MSITSSPGLDDPIWSEKDFATYIGQSVRSVKRMRAAGNSPVATRLSKHRVGFRLSHVMAWLAARIEPPRSGGMDVGGLALSFDAHHE